MSGNGTDRSTSPLGSGNQAGAIRRALLGATAAPSLPESVDTLTPNLADPDRIVTDLPAALTDLWIPPAQAFGWIAARGKPSATQGAIDTAREEAMCRLRAGELIAWLGDAESAASVWRRVETPLFVLGMTLHPSGRLTRGDVPMDQYAALRDVPTGPVWFDRDDVRRLWPSPEQAATARREQRIDILRVALVASSKWICAADIADWYAQQRGSVTMEEKAALYVEAMRTLFRSLTRGELVNGGLHPHIVDDAGPSRFLAEQAEYVQEVFANDARDHANNPVLAPDYLREYVTVIWLPAAAARQWLAARNIVPPPWLGATGLPGILASPAGEERPSEIAPPDDWPWLTIWQATTCIAFGRTDMPKPRLHTVPPWGDSYREKWGFQRSAGTSELEAWPVKQLGCVLERVRWRKAHTHPLREDQRCLVPPLPRADRAGIRKLLRGHHKPAAALLQEVLTDFRTDVAAQAAFNDAMETARGVLFRTAADGKITGFDRQERPLTRRDWAPSGPLRYDADEVQFRREDVLKLALVTPKKPVVSNSDLTSWMDEKGKQAHAAGERLARDDTVTECREHFAAEGKSCTILKAQTAFRALRPGVRNPRNRPPKKSNAKVEQKNHQSDFSS